MRVDAMLGVEPVGIADRARALEADAFDASWSGETAHDPFLLLTAAATATTRMGLGTGVAIALARNPMSLAMAANDLQTISQGRALLGLGSQIKPHIERRYSMAWSRPAARMREYVLAVRHIWQSWADGSKLDFRGEFFTHTLMTPVFDPGPNPYGNPPILLAAVGERMTAVAGEVADGLLVHSFVTERYLREVTLPALEAGAARAGRTRDDLTISYPVFVVTGTTDAELVAAATSVREQIAFYGSTPAYRPVLALHGWDDLHGELHTLSKQGRWQAMADLVDDDVLDAFAVVGSPTEVATLIGRRFGDLVDRVTLYSPYDARSALREIATELRSHR